MKRWQDLPENQGDPAIPFPWSPLTWPPKRSNAAIAVAERVKQLELAGIDLTPSRRVYKSAP